MRTLRDEGWRWAVLGLVVAALVGSAGPAFAEQAGAITLKVDTAGNPAATGTPVSSGVPFPRGWVSTVNHLRLETTQGTEIPANYWKLVSWPDGSIKSALISFVPTPSGDTYPNVVLEYGPSVSHSGSGPVQVTEDSSSMTVTTDVLKLKFSKTRFSILEQAWTDANGDGSFDAGEQWLTGAADLDVLDRKTSAHFRSSLWTSGDGYAPKLVEAGPRKVTLLLEGRLKGEGGAVTADGDSTLAQAKVWLSVHAGSSLVHVQTTLVDTKSRTTESFSDKILKLNSVSLNLPLTLSNASYAAGGEGGAVYQGPVGGGAHLLQDATATFSTQYAYDFNYSGVGAGDKAPGWMDFSAGGRGVMTGLRHFWQNYPQKLGMDGGNTVHVDFLPAGSPNYFWTVYPGVGKTYEGFVDFHAGSFGTTIRRRAELMLDAPMLIPTDVGWYATTKVFGPISEKSSLSTAWETRVENQYKCTVQRSGCSIYPLPYGQRNFGDYQQGFGTKSTGGYFPIYGDAHYEDAHGAMLQFARTGDRRWWDFGVPYARHHYDLDVMHTQNPPRYSGFPPGMIHWHGTSEHEGVNIEMGHVVPGGLDNYFYLTGDWRALDVLREQGDWIEHWARKGRSRIAPEKSTDSVGLEEYERVAAWNLYTIMKAYETTADPKYFEGASILVKNNIDWWKMPQNHIAFDHTRTLTTSESPESQALYFYRTDWTQGTGYPLPTLRVANCPSTKGVASNNYAYQTHVPIGWMSALLQTALIRYYWELDAQGGVFDKLVNYRGSDKPIQVDTVIMREMLIQMMKTVIEHNYLGASKYPSKYPWLAQYTYKFLTYAACTGRDPKSTDGGLYVQYPLLFISGFKQSEVGPLWQDQWTTLRDKFREIAKIQYDKFVVGKPNALTGYNGVPDLWNEPYAIKLFEDFGMFGPAPEPDPDPTPEPEPPSSVPAFGIEVNNGNPFLTSPSITLQLTAPSAATQANVSEQGYGQGAWQSIGQVHGIELTPEPGVKTLHVQFRDAGNTLLASLTKSVVLLGPSLAGDVELALNEAEDAHVLSSDASGNYGAAPALGLGMASATQDRWGLFQFELPLLPQGMTLKAARLELYQTGNTASASQVLTPYEPTGSWSEDSVTWSSKPGVAASGLGTGVTFDAQVNRWRSFTLNLTSAQQWFAAGPFRGIAVKGSGSPAMTSLEVVASESFSPIEDRRPMLVLVLGAPVVDTTPPVLSGLEVTPGQTTALIEWTTDEAANGTVLYGPTASFGQTEAQTAMVTDHAVTLTGLTANTTYHFQVTSMNGATLTATLPAATFQTTPVQLGDVNRDGQITQADVLALVGQLLGLQPVTLDVSDMNGDGRVTLGDVQALANLL